MRTSVKFYGALIKGALVDSGSSLSLVTTTTLLKLPERTSVEQFVHRPPNIVGVGNASVRVLGYVDVTVDIAGLEVRHPFIVVDELAYLILIGIDVLRPHEAITVTGAADVVLLQLDSCPVCIEERTSVTKQREVVGAVASILTDTTLSPHAASGVQVRLLPKVLGDSHFLAEPLPHELATASCATLPSVCSIIGSTHVLSLVNLLNKLVNLCAGTPIAAVCSLTLRQSSPSSNSAGIQHHPRNETISKVLTISIFMQSSSTRPQTEVARNDRRVNRRIC